VLNRQATAVGSRSGLPGIIDSQADVGGWPELANGPAPADSDHDGMPDEWETSHGLNPYDPADRNRINHDGYTYLEAYLDN
jgi:pectate lyase